MVTVFELNTKRVQILPEFNWPVVLIGKMITLHVIVVSSSLTWSNNNFISMWWNGRHVKFKI